MNSTPRGYKILDKRTSRKLGILYAMVNGTRYIVSVHFYFLGMQVSKRSYEFDSENEAEYFYKRSLLKLMGIIA